LTISNKRKEKRIERKDKKLKFTTINSPLERGEGCVKT